MRTCPVLRWPLGLLDCTQHAAVDSLVSRHESIVIRSAQWTERTAQRSARRDELQHEGANIADEAAASSVPHSAGDSTTHHRRGSLCVVCAGGCYCCRCCFGVVQNSVQSYFEHLLLRVPKLYGVLVTDKDGVALVRGHWQTTEAGAGADEHACVLQSGD